MTAAPISAYSAILILLVDQADIAVFPDLDVRRYSRLTSADFRWQAERKTQSGAVYLIHVKHGMID